MKVDADLLKSLHGCVKRTIVENCRAGIDREHATVCGVSSIELLPDGTLHLIYEGELWGQKYVVEFRKYPDEEVFRAYCLKPHNVRSSLVLLFKPIMTWAWTYQLQYGEK
jgi:hypothetical protein